MNKRINEIGSHFSYDDITIKSTENSIKPFWEDNEKDEVYTFSGRSAINSAIQDIKENRHVRKAYLPSYCCSSMIEPFLRNEIEIEFYEVYYDEKNGLNYKIDLNMKFDIFLAMSYFGINSERIDPFIQEFSARGIPVIEDVTHRLFSTPFHSDYSNYIVASIRKWLPINSGGYIRKEKDSFKHRTLEDSEGLVQLKSEAMYEKYRYLQGDVNIGKQIYFDKFIEFEKKLSEVGFSYKIDRESFKILQGINLSQIREIRRENAEVLYKGLESFKYIMPLIKDIDYKRDCPIFVPVVISNGKRDDLRKFLIERKIYCPVHWPNDQNRPEGIEGSSLSLICDQRYGEAEMNQILDSLIAWEKTVDQT